MKSGVVIYFNRKLGMDVQNLTNVSTVVINSLLILLKDNHIDVNSVVMQLSNNKDEAISPEVNLGELTQQTLDGLQAAKAQKVAVPEGFILVELNDLTTVLSNCSDAMMDESTSSVYDETGEPSTWFDHHVAAEGNLLLAIGKAQEPSHD